MGIQEERNLIDEINLLLDKVKDLDPNDLVREEELGKHLSFLEYLNDFSRIINFYKRLTNLNLSLLPYPQLSTIKSYVDAFLNNLKNIKEFKVDPNHGMNERNYVANQLIDNYQNDYNALSPIITFCEKEGTDYQSLQKKATLIVDEIYSKYSDIQGSFELQKMELDKILDAARQAVHEIGITQHTINFEQSAKNFKTISVYWFWGIILTALFVMGASYFVFNATITIPDNDPYPLYRFIQAAIARFTCLFTLLLILFWEIRNYNTAQHNYTVNHNKQNALSTFETFVSAANDEETKNVVLIQTTRSIFSNQPSGYLKSECADDGSSQIIEIAKTINAKIPN